MSYGVINQQLLTNIANAIRAKLGVATTYTPAEMPDAIASISGGSSADLGTKSITANGTYNASDDSLDGYSQVTVNVSGGSSVQTASGTCTGNGTNTSPEISCSFYPDIIMVEAVPPDDDVTWVGCMLVGIIRNWCATSLYCSNTSANIPNLTYVQSKLSSTVMTDYNENTYASRVSYATVDGSTITITNNTGSNAYGLFANGTTYNYTLIKYT